ncbi:MAG: peptide-methionine (S)-S-oxide reductase MsrA [Actinomycetota bacterium]
MQKEIAYLGGGCFWCLEAIFGQLKGVEEVQSGYSGGFRKNPTYEEVCSGNTGHAEVIKIRFDPEIISYRQLLKIFFSIHDPTTPNRQGNDVGSQYRSIILFTSENQKRIAKDYIKKLGEKNIYSGSIVTEVKPFKKFYKAENYHQNYFENNTSQPYCQTIISPKVEKFRKNFKNLFKLG